MAAFLIRRTIGAILVMLAVTFIVFLIFIIVPGGGKLGTAQRIAGKNATPQNVINIRHDGMHSSLTVSKEWKSPKAPVFSRR